MEKKLKIGVFGAGRGKDMVTVLAKHPDAELVAVCDTFQPGLDGVAKIAKEHNTQVALYTDFEEFIRHDMDAVVLANFAHQHAPYAIRLLKAGKHVLSEVVPCQTMAQAVALIEAVEESGKVYAYAENYCYMWHTFEMRRRYEAGDIGDVMYAEGEYVHDCSVLAPALTRGERDHWRNSHHACFYCTHSFGPIMTITGHRPVRVTGFVTQHNDEAVQTGKKGGIVGAVEMVTLDNGAIVRSLHGELKRQPVSVNYRIIGKHGSIESQPFQPTYAPEGAKDEVYLFHEGERLDQWYPETYAPDVSVFSDQYFTIPGGHGGSDFYPTHFFIQKILGRADGLKYSIDVYDAVDMGIIGILAYKSILEGGTPQEVPDLRNKEERDAWRNDNHCTDPEVASPEELWPCYPTGNLEYPESLFDRMKACFREGRIPE